ncbi:hypothetical protein [Rhizobium sp. SYY.PMSO]|uniref:hypothetical protein n=1 Tax=Rhizobium sp. SYY.PMSO TaxID=3382192 RepID=UPI0013AF47FB
MTFNARLTTITATGLQSWIAFGFPAMVLGDPLDPVYRSFRSQTVIPRILVLVKLFQQKSPLNTRKSLIHRLRAPQSIASRI